MSISELRYAWGRGVPYYVLFSTPEFKITE